MNEDRRITEERKAQFREVLYEGEKSRATIEKYMRDLEKLEVFLSVVWAGSGGKSVIYCKRFTIC